MNKIYDCIVIGAGPSGGTAAYHLAKKGRSVAVLEKAALPRYKPCGGGISPQIAEWFDFDFNPVISRTVKYFRYTWNAGEPIDVELDKPIWMVRRDAFDHLLIKESEKHGAEIRENTTVTKIDFNNGGWQAYSDNEEIFHSRYLIAADGAKGQTAKYLGFKQTKRLQGAAIEAEAKCNVPPDFAAHFEFGMVQSGYLWNFPKADGYSFGIGTFRGANHQALKKILENYAETFNIDFKVAERHGHPICIWDGNQNLHTYNERAILAGEAACIVDPLTIEGIRPSIFSGLKAAESVDRALSGDNNSIENYTLTIKREIGRNMWYAEILAKLFYGFPRFCYKFILQKPSASKAMSRVFSGEMTYRELVYKLLPNLHKVFLK